MQFLLDHVGAILVGMTVFLIMIALQFQAGEAMVDHTQYYAARQQLLSFTEGLEADLQNIGLGAPDSTSINTVDSTVIEFVRLLDLDDTVLSTIRYELVASDTVEIDGADVTLYEIQRFEDGVLSGMSPAYISDFTLELRDEDGAVVTDPDAAAAVHVALTMISPFKRDNYLDELHWARTIYAPNM
jgi:hypothetical protein